MSIINLGLKKKPSETELAYIWRIGREKDSGQLDLTWEELTDVLNSELRDPDETWSESAYRKKYALIKAAYEQIFSFASEESDFTEQYQELEKLKVQIRDERNEYRRLLREQARRESFYDQIIRSVSEHVSGDVGFDVDSSSIESDNDLIVHLTDLHTGIDINNWFNQYNSDVLKKRLTDFIGRIQAVQKRHGSENMYLILGGDMISGNIHPTLRIENNQDLIDQFLTVCDYLSAWIADLSSIFKSVHVYITPGNHSRMTAKKDEGMAHENMDNLIIPYLSAKLQNYESVHFHHNDVEQSIAMFTVRGNNVFASHGDKDTSDNVVQHLTMMFGIKPDICYLGHRHYNAYTTSYDTKVIQSGCLSGSDSFCLDHRLKNQPEQTITVVNADGVDCIYDVKFD